MRKEDGFENKETVIPRQEGARRTVVATRRLESRSRQRGHVLMFVLQTIIKYHGVLPNRPTIAMLFAVFIAQTSG